MYHGFVGSPAEEFGPYRVHEQIGVGGMATVHRAETQGIGGFTKQIALKRMLPGIAANADLVQSFIREARLASHLRHANVAQTYDLGKVGDVYFIAMELVPGRNLREILSHCSAVAGNIPLPIAMNIVNQICDALDYAHNLCDESGTPLGIIHRDVSPSNIIVSEGGVVKLIDFGIAKATGAGLSTLSGTVKGKFTYMAPETLLGDIDARADLFALGVIAHELLTNKPLFQGKDDLNTIYKVKEMKIDPPSAKNPQVPPEIDTIVMTALERDPDQRWQRASAMRTALTTETKRLGLIAHDHEVFQWIEWAFRQGEKPNEDSVIISIANQTPLARPVPGDFLADSVETVVRPPSHDRAKPGTYSDERIDWQSNSAAQTMPHDLELGTKADLAMLAQSTVRERPFNVATTPDAPSATLQGVDWDVPSIQPTPLPEPPAPGSAYLVPRNTPSPLPQRLAPLGSYPSGARTVPHIPRDAVPVSASSVLDERQLALPAASPVPHATAPSAKAMAKPKASGGRFLLAVLVLIVAGGAAAVVYFALPYLT